MFSNLYKGLDSPVHLHLTGLSLDYSIVHTIELHLDTGLHTIFHIIFVSVGTERPASSTKRDISIEQSASAMGSLLPCLLLKDRQYEKDGGWVK